MTHSEARAIIVQAWRRVHGRDPTPLEALYTQAIASLETGYGRAGQFAAMASRGQFNWGAEQRRRGSDGECPAGFASGNDQGPVCFFVFPSDVEAAAAFIRTLTATRWPTVAAMRGSPEDVARAMRGPPPYYVGLGGSEEDRIRAYANVMRSNIAAIGRTVPLPTIPTDVSSGFPWIIVLGLAGGLGYLYVREYGNPVPGLTRSVERAFT